MLSVEEKQLMQEESLKSMNVVKGKGNDFL